MAANQKLLKAQTAMSKHTQNIQAVQDHIKELKDTTQTKRDQFEEEEVHIAECQTKIAEQVTIVSKLAPASTPTAVAAPQPQGPIESLMGSSPWS
eukprot:9237848-Pyramimonas_sp.AAC.1